MIGTVGTSCSASSSNLCSTMSNCYNYHSNPQNWRSIASPLPSASSSRFIVSSEFLGIISLPNPKSNHLRIAGACSRFQLIVPRSTAGNNTNNNNNDDNVSTSCKNNDENQVVKTLQQWREAIPSVYNRSTSSLGMVAAGLLAAVIVSGAAGSIEMDQVPVYVAQSRSQVLNEAEQESGETMENIPQTLSGECAVEKDCKKPRIQRPKSRKAETCTIKCVTTCVRGGEGSPGEGPFNIRRPLVVFKEGFRSRRYCLVECSDICNLIGEGDDGP